MESPETQAAVRRMQQAFGLFEAGVSMKRASLRREHPDANDARIAELLREWLHERPGAEHGDAPGRPRDLGPYRR
ncbi:MAG: hypothetical protein KF809_10230 [Chloroflexi bacterium]|nr:hypothetical protein [Chloroflexota bacterium]